MTGKKPILVLQMHRMGDLILSFPLILWLQREYPGHPLWVVGEPRFYEALLTLSPKAMYMPWSATQKLRSERFFLCLNLSHEPAAALLAGEVHAENVLGALDLPGRGRYVRGSWQLYRTGLVQANRHNRYHWADLNALDCIPLQRIRSTRWPWPRSNLGDRRRIALFLGASDQSKRPDPAFWAALAGEMLRRDLRPILLGGPDDMALAEEVRKLLKQKILNLTGRLSLAQMAHFGQGVELMITPDTGPMHLAAWTGLRVLNLSMGPVNPWETGPYQPGHFVLQAGMSCAGCWHCTRLAIHCHDRFQPRRIAQIAHHLCMDTSQGLATLRVKGLNMFGSARTSQGLFHLTNLLQQRSPDPARELLGRFWSLFWGFLFGLWPDTKAVRAWKDLEQTHPATAEIFVRSLTGFHRKLRREAQEESFWRQGPPLLRPLFSHIHLVLQNEDFSAAGRRQALRTSKALLLIVAEGSLRSVSH